MKTVKLVKNKTIRKNFSLDKEKNPIETEHRDQVDTVNKIYLGIDIEEHKNIIGELRKKTNSYKTQDEKKDRYDISSFIKNEELYEKLVVSKLRCFYCSKEVKVVYGYVRDDFQWTLDRIDNGIGHSSEDTVISCLKCNLQRRVTDCKKFEFTKKLRIKRENYL